MVLVIKPGTFNAQLKMSRTGFGPGTQGVYNDQFFQSIKFLDCFEIENGEKVKSCFWIKLLNRKLLIVLEGCRVYEKTEVDNKIVYFKLDNAALNFTYEVVQNRFRVYGHMCYVEEFLGNGSSYMWYNYEMYFTNSHSVSGRFESIIHYFDDGYYPHFGDDINPFVDF